MKPFQFLLLLVCCHSAVAGSRLDSLGIRVTAPSREFIFTNGEAAHLFGETGALPRSGWHGFTVCGRELLDGYALLVNEAPLKDRAAATTVFPDFLRRVHPNGIIEEVHPLDSIDAFVITIQSPRPVSCTFIPIVADVRDTAELSLRALPGGALCARRTHLAGAATDPAPAWLAFHSPAATPLIIGRREGRRMAPLLLHAPRRREHRFIVAAGRGPEALLTEAQRILPRAESAFISRRQRMERLLRESEFRSDHPRFNSALAWAKLSLNALIMRQGHRGIFAGLPWFNNYWGRDTFIALPGATLVTGRNAVAREILAGFAAEQQRDTASTDYGRIPNFVGPRERGYNTADGTPRFVMMARALAERSGDLSLLRTFYPAVIRSIEGTLRHHVDTLGFLTHADAETWMDAVGPAGPWSPRGNRANDIQALWGAQLEAGIWFATRLGDAGSAVRWNEALTRLKRNFIPFFLHEGKIADRLLADGTPDLTLRPNQIFLGPLLDDSLRASVLEQVLSRLTYPHGVASLSQDDDRFHPYHQHPPFYPKDAAYHNGTVWTWLQGGVISELCRFGFADTAWRLTANTVRQILDRGAVGTQSELLDAIPRPGEKDPALSGTVSQAWNLAEFIRNVYDDYLGVRVDGVARSVTFTPSLPDSLGHVEARIPAFEGGILFRSWIEEGKRRYAFRSEGLPPGIRAALLLRTGPGVGRRISFTIPTGSFAEPRATGEETRFPGYPADLPAPAFALPRLRDDLASLRGPLYPLLEHREVKPDAGGARLVVSAADPIGDDHGVVDGISYSYPLSPLFIPGSFDLTRFELNEDSTRLFFRLSFRALSDPGWHPEYGFQLTCAAIAIDTDGAQGTGGSDLLNNSRYRLPDGAGFERLLLIGGGLRVLDHSGSILAEYAPLAADAALPLGDASTGVVSFALPRTLLPGDPRRWRFTIVAGAQDDHGGAGVGEFRSVGSAPGEWQGGGKSHPDLPNLYDLLIVPPTQH